MPLTLVTGPANAAKAGEVLGAFRALASRDPFLVVPTAADALHYERELAAGGALIGGRVGTFDSFVVELARRAGTPEAALGEVERERVVAAAIRDAGLRAFAPSSRAPGFLRAAVRLEAELGRERVTPQRLRQALGAWAGRRGRRAAHAREVAAIHAAYVARLERMAAMDREGRAWRALDALRAEPSRWGATPVLLYGFDDLTAPQRDAVETLAGRAAAEVWVSIPYERGRAAFADRAGLAESLLTVADRVVDLPAMPGTGAPELHHLERGLYEPDAVRVEAGDAVRLIESGGERAEIEHLGAEILELLAAGVPAGEIAVVFRSPASYGTLLAEVFGAYGIPYALRRAAPLSHTALGGGLIGLARCAAAPREARAGDLLAWLRAPGADAGADAVDAAEAALLRAGEDGLPAARRAWERGGRRLPGALERLRTAASAGGAELARGLRAEAPRLLSAGVRGSLGAGEAADAAALGAADAALAELERLPDIAAGEVLEALRDVEVLLDPGVPRPGAVLVADPLAIRARRFRAVLVGGLQEDEFPRPASGEPFLGDEERREVAVASGLVLARGEMAREAERHLFYTCVSRPTERLVLSWRSSTEEGVPVRPSALVDEVLRLFEPGLLERRGIRLLSEVTWAPERAPTEDERRRSAAARGPRVPERPLGDLPPGATAKLRQRDALSPGALERYWGCPASWLVADELRPRALEPDPEALDRGSFVHAVLERTLAGLRAEAGGAAAVEAATLDRALDLADEALAALAPGHRLAATAAGRDGVLRAVRASVRGCLEQEARAALPWAAQRLEWAFGMERAPGSSPALELGEGVRVHGRVDRIDHDGASGGSVVRDYKTGMAHPSWSVNGWERSRRLQVALYMLAVREVLGERVGGGVFEPVGGSQRPRGLVLSTGPAEEAAAARALYGADLADEEGVAERLAEAAARARELGCALLGGELAPSPQTCGLGECRHPGICRSGA